MYVPQEAQTMSKYTARLELSRKPRIGLRTSNDGPKHGKLGGLPDLPASLAWPRHTISNTPLHFLAQINLGALPVLQQQLDGSDLPASGFLFLFGDVNEEADWDEREPQPGTVSPSDRVIYAANIGTLTAPPNDIPEIGHASDESDGGYSNGCRIAPERRIAGYVIDTFAGLQSPRPVDPDYQDEALALVNASMERAAGSRRSGMMVGQMLGAPESVNGFTLGQG
jgi:Domain of unknown function (DUF1963)